MIGVSVRKYQQTLAVLNCKKEYWKSNLRIRISASLTDTNGSRAGDSYEWSRRSYFQNTNLFAYEEGLPDSGCC